MNRANHRACGDSLSILNPLGFLSRKPPPPQAGENVTTDHWGLKSRVEDYRQALREAMRLERLFAGPDSKVLAEIHGQVEAEIAEEEER